ncbi:MAG: beta-Ig-H3/fasciclin [Flammeovirgaceae bacterium]|nr:beta-Ig-H3/fasciclin [Flammeovirgaceae bacterium]
MKKLTVSLTTILSFTFAVSVIAQGEHPSNKTVSNTIVDVAVSNKDFSTLVTALKAADLVGALQGDGPFTVFAPTNDAFAKIDSKALSSLLEEENKNTLANILTYHVIAGKLAATDVVTALEKGNGSVVLTALNGEAITVMQKDGKIWLKDTNDNYSEITATDVIADNGVIHVINTVVMPKND